MSRIGFKPIPLPEGVTFSHEGSTLLVKGPKGEVSVHVPAGVSVDEADGVLHVRPAADWEEHKESAANHGTAAALVHNAVKGVSEGWKKELEINGTGYRASVKDGVLTMFLGYSHEVHARPIGKYTKISCPDETHVVVEGVDKFEVGETAARIYDLRRPDPYGQKGVHYKGQHLIKKVGKRAAASGKK